MKPFLNFHTHQLDPNFVEKGVYNLMVDEIEDYHFADNQWVSVGIHPWYAQEATWKQALKNIDKKLSNSAVVAVGECGLDKLRGMPLAQQMIIFEAQVALAAQYRKPVIVHCVKAHNELIAWRKRTKLSIPIVVHGFNNNLQIAHQLLNQGFYLSLGAALLVGESNANAVLKMISLDKLFLETDDKLIAISTLYEHVATVLEMDIETLKNNIWKNFSEIIGK